MKNIILSIACSFALTGCASWIPGLTQVIDDAITDEVVGVTIDKGAMGENTEIKVNIDVTKPAITPTHLIINGKEFPFPVTK